MPNTAILYNTTTIIHTNTIQKCILTVIMSLNNYLAILEHTKILTYKCDYDVITTDQLLVVNTVQN